jgi:hypothetical protein
MRPFFVITFVVVLASAPVQAQPPAPLDSTQFAFPGSFDKPASARAAGLAMADSWLGDEPFYNPAVAPARRVDLSPVVMWVSRQDLRAANRNYDDSNVSFDLAGAALALPYLPVWIYVHQPVLRFEDYTYTRGTGTDPSVPPATISGQSDTREGRVGVAGSLGLGRMRAGAAVEWIRRQDRYFIRERSGAPDQGDRELTFDGNAVGGTFGLRYASADTGAHRLVVGAAVRYLPTLPVEGEQVITLYLIEGYSTSVSAERESGWEGGLTIRYDPVADLAVMASGSQRTKQEWTGFDLVSGAASSWRVAMEYHDDRDPWTARLGLGQDHQDDVPERNAGVLGVGLGWELQGVVLDVGVLHRSIERENAPRSYEDGLIATVHVGF